MEKIDIEEAASFIENGGALSTQSDTYEERPVQVELLKNIADGFNRGLIGAFEAGTGVGKSYAYLIPSMLWAVKNKERVIISTGTINLQQQLCEKDIPAVEKILGQKIKFVLVKGRQNYICKRRLMETASVLDLFEDETAEIKRIADWEETCSTGSKSDMTFMPTDNAWTKVNSESDACMGKRCPFFNECYVMKVRKEAASANLIVVNHHLLFADIETRMNGAGYEDASVLPPYKRIVFDEAHGIEAAATSFFSESLNRFKINKLIFPMYRKRKGTEYGHLCSIAVFSKNDDKLEEAYDLTNKIKTAMLNLEIAAKDLMRGEYTLRLCQATARDFGPFLVCTQALAEALGNFVNLVRLIMDGVSDEDKDVPCMWEAKAILRRLDMSVILLKNFSLWDEKKENVYWIQQKRLPPDYNRSETDLDYVTLTQTPLDISGLMQSGVFEEMSSVICTSATLAAGKDFGYWCRRTGLSNLDPDRVSCKSFASPFPYDKNMLFAVASDAPLSNQSEFQPWIEMAIPRLIKAAEGRTLVLFTSYESLKSAHKTCVSVLRGFNGLIMKQGDDDNSKLLERFKNDNESVLFATDSFWQGVDIPGESLSQVIIVKLPFSVPNDPVFMARSEAIEKRGGSSFMELSVPEAVIKFRQGTGRLIRRSDDKGVVTVLDKRIYEKRYGASFVNSLYECKKAYEPLQELTEKIKRFIFD